MAPDIAPVDPVGTVTRGEYQRASGCTLNAMEVAERFWSKVDKSGDCWLWTAATDPMGYGRFHVESGSQLAHRWAYEAIVGPIPAGMVIDHLCFTPACVNPAHMELVTLIENLRRRREHYNLRKTRCPKGHAYDEANTYHYPDGRRACRECIREASREYRRKNRDAINARRAVRRTAAARSS